MLMGAATVVQVLQDMLYVLLHVLFYLWSLLKLDQNVSNTFQDTVLTMYRDAGRTDEQTEHYASGHNRLQKGKKTMK